MPQFATKMTNAEGVASHSFDTHLPCIWVEDHYEVDVFEGWGSPRIETPTTPDYVGAYWEQTDADLQTLYVCRDEVIAQRFTPVLHKHWGQELQTGLAKPEFTLERSTLEVRSSTPPYLLLWTGSASEIHVIDPDCIWDTFAEVDGVFYQVDIDNGIWYWGAIEGERPLFYHVYPFGSGAVVEYWIWLNCNDTREYVPGEIQVHEGDWEHVAIKVVFENGYWKPQALNFYRHQCRRTISPEECWWSVTNNPGYYDIRQGYTTQYTHPHVWIAANSHGSYNRHENVYHIDCGNLYWDRVDYNIADQPRGDHAFFEYDLLRDMGEYWKGNHAHGCDWEHYHWEGGPLEFAKFDGYFGVEIPGSSTKGPVSPISHKRAVGTWGTFVVDYQNWCEDPGFPCSIWWEAPFRLEENYLGKFATCIDGTAETIHFEVPSIPGWNTIGFAEISIESGDVVFANEESGKIELGPPQAGKYVFHENEVGGEGRARITIYTVTQQREDLAIDLASDVFSGCGGVTGVEGDAIDAGERRQIRLSPNPVLKARGIKIETKTDAKIMTAEIISADGRRVAALELENLADAGRNVYEVNWDCTDERGNTVRPGVFFVRFLLEDRSELVRKIVVLR